MGAGQGAKRAVVSFTTSAWQRRHAPKTRLALRVVAKKPHSVTSVDWVSYPILELADAPESIDIVLINQSDIAPSGAGEPSIRSIPGAVANAFFDATGVRIRRAPLTPERVKAALAHA